MKGYVLPMRGKSLFESAYQKVLGEALATAGGRPVLMPPRKLIRGGAWRQYRPEQIVTHREGDAMKLEPPKNQNYCATVVRVKNIVPLEGCDNLVGLPLFGLQAIVGKDTQIGDLGIVLPTECQLSEEFCKANNLFRHANLNADPDKAGYLEDNRRVRAIKLRGHRSDALFMPLSSINYLFALQPYVQGSQLADSVGFLKEGDTFDTLGGREICCKYVITITTRTHGLNARRTTQSRTDARFFPEQFDVAQFFRVEERLDPAAWCVVTQKLHGTSLRVGNVPVARKLTLLERIARKLGVRVQTTEYDYVYGSHHVVKDANNPEQRHFYDYDDDIWTREGRKLDGVLPEGYIVYGELIGWTANGAPIQKHYTYNCAPSTCRLYVYRVTFVNPQGVAVDLSWDAVKEFCLSAGLTHVPELWRGQLRDFDPTLWLDHAGYADLRQFIAVPEAVPLAEDSPCEEGVCIRIEGLTPQILKAKSPLFLQHETKMLDAGTADIEAAEGDSGVQN